MKAATEMATINSIRRSKSRTKKWMSLKPSLYEGRIMDRHQAYWFCQQRVRSRFANHPIVEFPLIKRSMLRPYGRRR